MRTSRSSHSSQRISKTSSQKRSIVTPHPASAALIQASFKASRPASARKLRAGTKNQFASELELFMAEQLEECKTEEEKHQIYRNTFTSIINRFENYRDSMIAIKDGYESIIDNLTDEINKSEVNNQSTMKSQNEFLILLDEEKQKMDQKSENYNKLAQQLHEQISRMFYFI
ncbi:hypothetical protein TRFO_13736 [Tritrichomonas foetus]|uniref:Translin-associated factor X-interacting protein 1 N-terminal domain-containing protein n=1 Tax=Tritrichomonas foetus TaxID=1144522 RepID=A0A1J4KXA9_9EUKA|nr:hypothetical protein TRFO_13736 [Tritrichomonas foetus]|eukprot:OHT15889.1 hypothetical protein TRFO_13736 [Tritrichomonas foetus]